MRRITINRQDIFKEIEIERDRQDKIHPLSKEQESNNPDIRALRLLILSSDFLSILVEEVGEVGRALQGEKDSDLKVELIHVASVCVRWLESLN